MIKRISIQQILCFFLFIAILIYPISSSVAVEDVTLQLKWTHQFQFAGYYAAIEKGYYKQKDLNVTLVEGKPGKNEVDEVISGRANFGVGMSDLLLARLKGKSVVILANIFQHSPSVLMTMKESGISSPQDLFGKRVMMVSGYKSAELQAMLTNEGIPADKVNILKPSWKLDDLIDGKTEAMAGYISSAPYFLQKKNLPYVIIFPKSYGIDFYGDNLFTSEQEIEHHPDRVKAFMEASLKGWQYALKNSEEIIDIILLKYTVGRKNLTKEFLINEASVYQNLILPDFVKIGHINPGRWKHIADTYAKLGMIDKDYSLKGLIYNPVIGKFDWGHWAVKSGIGAILFAFGLVIFLVFVNRRINKEIAVRKQVEIELKKSEELFRTVFEQSGGYCMILKPSDSGIPTILDVNEAACKAHDYHRDEMIGRPVADLDDEEGKRLCIERTQLIMSGNPFVTETNHVRKDGSIFPVIVYANIVQFGDKEPLIVTTEFDISDKKKAETERKSLENRLHQAQKIESVGQLAGGIAHDFNNILYPILGFTQMVIDDLPRTHKVQEDLKDILDGAKRAKDLVKRILLFSRQKEQILEPIMIRPVIEETLKLMRSSIPANIRIQQDLYNDKDYILCDPTEIHEIVMNLCTNAYHAIENDDGIITIGLNKIKPPDELNLKSVDYVCLSVSDNGMGIPPEKIDKIFEPYFTTKDIGKGSGLGLSVVHGIVQNYDGAIQVESDSGSGTALNIFLPVTPTPDKDNLKQGSLNSLAGNERILFVDDEPTIVKFAVKALERKGYNVTGMQNPLEALSLLKSNPFDYDLVVTDMAMPGMVGSRLAKKILEVQPDMPIIICSGYSQRLDTLKAVELNIQAFIDKPLLIEDLMVTVRNVLDQSSGDINGKNIDN